MLGAGAGDKGFGNGKDLNIGKGTQFQKGHSGSPAGKPKGTVHLSTMIRQMLDDPAFIEKLSNT